MTMILVSALFGCSRDGQPAKQGPMQLQPPPGATWVSRAMPTWPPTSANGFQPIAPDELASALPSLSGAQLVDGPRQSGGNPFVAQASYCIASSDLTATAAAVTQAIDSEHWQTTELGRQLQGTAIQVARDKLVLTVYAAAGRWPSCGDPKRQVYVTFVAGKQL